MTDTLSRERKLREVLNYYDPIVNKLDAHVDGPETDFVMRRDDYRIMRAALRSRSGVVVPEEVITLMEDFDNPCFGSAIHNDIPHKIGLVLLAARPKE